LKSASFRTVIDRFYNDQAHPLQIAARCSPNFFANTVKAEKHDQFMMADRTNENAASCAAYHRRAPRVAGIASLPNTFCVIASVHYSRTTASLD
jgi:hypothetical protein